MRPPLRHCSALKDLCFHLQRHAQHILPGWGMPEHCAERCAHTFALHEEAMSIMSARLQELARIAVIAVLESFDSSLFQASSLLLQPPLSPVTHRRCNGMCS